MVIRVEADIEEISHYQKYVWFLSLPAPIKKYKNLINLKMEGSIFINLTTHPLDNCYGCCCVFL